MFSCHRSYGENVPGNTVKFRVCCGTLFVLDPIDESQSLKCVCHDNNDMVRSVCTGLEFIRHFGAQSLHSTII